MWSRTFPSGNRATSGCKQPCPGNAGLCPGRPNNSLATRGIAMMDKRETEQFEADAKWPLMRGGTIRVTSADEVDLMTDEEITTARVSGSSKRRVHKLVAEGKDYLEAKRSVIKANFERAVKTAAEGGSETDTQTPGKNWRANQKRSRRRKEAKLSRAANLPASPSGRHVDDAEEPQRWNYRSNSTAQRSEMNKQRSWNLIKRPEIRQAKIGFEMNKSKPRDQSTYVPRPDTSRIGSDMNKSKPCDQSTYVPRPDASRIQSLLDLDIPRPWFQKPEPRQVETDLPKPWSYQHTTKIVARSETREVMRTFSMDVPQLVSPPSIVPRPETREAIRNLSMFKPGNNSAVPTMVPRPDTKHLKGMEKYDPWNDTEDPKPEEKDTLEPSSSPWFQKPETSPKPFTLRFGDKRSLLENSTSPPASVKRSKMDTAPSTEIRIAVVSEGFQMEPSELIAVETAILDALEQTSEDGPQIRLLDTTFKQGYLVVICADSVSAQWLRGVVPSLKPWNGASLRAKDEVEISRPYTCTVFIPDKDGKRLEADRILARLRVSNHGLNTSLWNCCGKTPLERGQVWVFSMDKESLEELKKLEMAPFFGIGKVEFQLREDRPSSESGTLSKLSSVSEPSWARPISTDLWAETKAKKTKGPWDKSPWQRGDPPRW